MNNSQQQFEESIKLHAAPEELEQKLKKSNNGLNYADRDVDLMWVGWQASRDTMELVGYTSRGELREMTCGIVGLVNRNKNFVNHIPVYIHDRTTHNTMSLTSKIHPTGCEKSTENHNNE